MTESTEPKVIDASHFQPNPGFVLILPFDKLQKSSIVNVVDTTDRPYIGEIIAVGDPRMTDYGFVVPCPNRKGDVVQYSIAGCEETKMKYKENLRERFIIAPFGRILGTIKE